MAIIIMKGMALHVIVVVIITLALLLLQSTSAFLAQPTLRSKQHCNLSGAVGFKSVNKEEEKVEESRRSLLLLFLAAEKVTASSSSSSDSESSAGTGTNLPKASSSLSFPDSLDEIDWSSIGKQFLAELQEVAACLAIAAGSVLKSSSSSSSSSSSAEDIVALCDEIDDLKKNKEALLVSSREPLHLRRRALEFQRYQMLVNLMQNDYAAYTATASFLSPSRIPRQQLPNVQDVVLNEAPKIASTAVTTKRSEKATAADDDGDALVSASLVADCELDDMEYKDSILDKLLLSIFRKLVEQNTGGVTSEKAGIEGLLEQGRTFMLQPNQTPEAQHEMVSKTLGGLMTPVLPPFYRIFMSGIIPNNNNNIIPKEWNGKQLGPWFYAPFLTSIVTPTFFAFLVGPSRPNRRQDGQRGGLLVEKCKFLQESNCKGLCLHQCKLPAQQFFQQELGLALTVSPNFVTQECQWSFGQVPLPPNEDPSFPKGCLVGCQSRQALTTYKDLCN